MSKFPVATATLVGLMLAAAPAPAAVVEISGGTLTLRDSGSEQNWPTIGETGDGKLSISDSMSDITAWPAACAPSDDSSFLVCPMPTTYVAELGDGNDNHSFGELPGTLALDLRGGEGGDQLEPWDRADGSPIGASRTVDGGGGDDKIIGSSGVDTLRGGGGNDSIDAYGGADVVEGGDGNDTLSGDRGHFNLSWAASFVGDSVDGGPGVDRFEDYHQGATGVTVTLDGVANDGRAGENDNLIGIEFVQSRAPGTYTGSEGPDEFEIFYDTTGTVSVLKGLAGNDSLEGDHNAQQFDGGSGDDYLEGGYGDDTFVGGPNRDTFMGYRGDDLLIGGGASDTLASTNGFVRAFGGPGDDQISVADGRAHGPPDEIDCGDGVDSAGGDTEPPNLDRFATDCESTSVNGRPWAGPFRPEYWEIPSIRVNEDATLLKAGLRVRVACRAKAFPCRGRVVIRRLTSSSRAKIGGARFTPKSKKAKHVRVDVPASAGVRRGGRVVSTVRVRDARDRRTGTAAELIVR